MRCIGPRLKDVDLSVLTWEELHRVHQDGILVEVEHVKAHRSKKEMQQVSLFQWFITEGNNMKVQGKCEGPKWLREDSKHKL